jgi:hypothetical protein
LAAARVEGPLASGLPAPAELAQRDRRDDRDGRPLRDHARSSLGALPLSIWRGSIVPCMIRGIGDRGECKGVS